MLLKTAFVLILSSCSAGLQGGSIAAKFNGIQKVIVMGPETVSVVWTTNANCINYPIYQLSASTTSSVATGTIPPVSIKAPIVQSARPYTFAVACTGTDGNLSGLDTNYSVSTWPKFNGVLSSSLDTTGQNPIVNLSWNYPSTDGTLYYIYATQSNVPGDLATWGLTPSGNATGDYLESYVCQTYKNSIRIGTNGDCNPQGLNSGNIYNFKVIAKYPDGSFSTDLVGNGTSILLPAAFAPPTCILTHNGIGADASSSYLFLRCDANAGGTSCAVANMSIKAYQAINGVRTLVSDTLNGAGTLRIQPQIDATAANDRVVKGLEVEYTCNATTPPTKSIVRYDGANPLTPAPVLKYNNTSYDAAPVQSYQRAPSYLGNAMAIGDFDCDGHPDIAVGLPYVTFNQTPYFNKNSQSGAVKIYYNYTQDATGNITGTSTQYLSFRDLGATAWFGYSLSSGNINKDIYSPDTNNYYSCDDLIIGAPGAAGFVGSATGAAYIFYGHPQKFAQPLDASGLAVNAPTCSGNLTNEVCSPVKLIPDTPTYFNLHPSYSNLSQKSWAGGGAGISSFGWAVSYIRDFNADGYGDIAVGDPTCSWDGEVQNNNPNPQTGGVVTITSGCVFVYFGGSGGITTQKVGHYPNGTGTAFNSPYIKVYPPLPQQNMRFGESISGGGDVDGRLPVPVPMDGGTSIILAEGNDFIVGASLYQYNPPNSPPNTFGNTQMGTVHSLGWTVNEGSSMTGAGCTAGTGAGCPVDPSVLQGINAFSGSEASPNSKVTPPWNGAWAPGLWNNSNGAPVPANAALAASSGIAFLYLGRSSLQNYAIALKDGFHKFPNMVQTTPLPSALENYLSLSLRDRQNGSPYLTLSPAITSVSYPQATWPEAPLDSFYNCGTRGSPTGWATGADPIPLGTFKHISCLAGRNNFSVIYPIVAPPATNAVAGFGSTVKIAGGKEQNAIALYELTSILGNANSATAYSRSTLNSMDLVPYAQGYVHDRIRGTSTWEMAVKSLNTNTIANACETFNDATGSNPVFSNAGCPGYTGVLARSPLKESYTFPSSAFNAPQPQAIPQVDINRDGYADVVVGTLSTPVYTFYGNYAADFSYSGTSSTTSPSCVVARPTSTPNNSFSNSLSAVPSPYATFVTESATTNVASVKDYFISSEVPHYFSPSSPGKYIRLSFLNDITEFNGPSFDFAYQTITRVPALGLSCLPLVKNLPGAVTSMAAADLNNDGLTDLVFGMSGYNLSQGRTVSSIAGNTGNGLAVDVTYSSGVGNGKFGSGVDAAHWKFIDGNHFMQETSRRDLFIGSSGYNSGDGAIYAYTGSGNNTIGSSPNVQFLENSNSPNTLGGVFSINAGDINGDGYDDILTPVKQVAANGTVYYDAILYFGSAYGPVTYAFCANKRNLITYAAGGTIALSECQGSISSQSAYINGTAIHLPQYIQKPSGLQTATWITNAFPAGDVDQDGHGDIVIFEAPGSVAVTYSYLYFGSDSGIVNGSPIMGAASNHNPQLISSQFLPFPYTMNSNYYRVASQGQLLAGKPQLPVVHGDFNGDGYQDLAVGLSYDSSPRYNGAWNCSAATSGNPLYGYICGGGGTPAANPGPSYVAFGNVYIVYGGPYGYQTPVNGGGIPIDFDILNSATMPEVCSDMLSNCTYGGAAKPLYSRGIYNTLTFNAGTGAYSVDTTKTACDPSTGVCQGQFIHNPLFFNDIVGGDSFLNQGSKYFGDSLAVADVNNDGIDDLVVSAPGFFHASYSNMVGSASVYNNATIFGQNTQDGASKGQIFLYYGARGAGLVAPPAVNMVADNGYALSTTNALPAQNRSVFALYPMTRTVGVPSTYPEFDQSFGLPTEAGRAFAAGMNVGDFNGDGFDDIVAVSRAGQIYVYYGPICQIDNAKSTWQGTVYTNHQKAVAYVPGAINPGDCTLLNLNTSLLSGTSNPVQIQPAASKLLYPQMLYIPGTSAIFFGNMIVSRRPTRAVASTTIVKNPGNINGDPEGTSDLLLGTMVANDPNISPPNGKNSGLGYILFGHKLPSVGDMQTLPGLYVSSGTYNGSIVSAVSAGITNFFYAPVIVKPHASDNSVDRFFEYPPMMGDFNGDGTGDILFPTTDIQFGSDGTPVISGGGFKLFY